MHENMRSIQSKHIVAFAILVVVLALFLVSRLVDRDGVITGRATLPAEVGLIIPAQAPISALGIAIGFPIIATLAFFYFIGRKRVDKN